MSAWTGWYWLLGAEPEGRPGHVVGSDLITSAHEFDLSCSRFQTVTGSSDAGAQRASRRITSSGQSRHGYRDNKAAAWRRLGTNGTVVCCVNLCDDRKNEDKAAAANAVLQTLEW